MMTSDYCTDEMHLSACAFYVIYVRRALPVPAAPSDERGYVLPFQKMLGDFGSVFKVHATCKPTSKHPVHPPQNNGLAHSCRVDSCIYASLDN